MRRPLSEALAISNMVVFSTPFRAKSCLATSMSLSRVLRAMLFSDEAEASIFGVNKEWCNSATDSIGEVTKKSGD